ncbi:MAG: hypothetical protein GY778_19545 [bacterium]|nr:hypothetical protein [bacterium]
MDQPERITDDLLLGYVLERCTDDEASRIVEALRTDADLAARHGRLAEMLEPLGTWTTPEPPPTMVSDILDAIGAPTTLKFEPAASTLPPGSEADFGRSPILSLRELVALAACITIFVSVFVPALSTARFNSRRQMCANNLASMFRGTTSYATANAGMLPGTAWPEGGSWLTRPGQPRVSNRRQVYLVLRMGYVATPKQLVCPDRRSAAPMDESQVAGCDDFPEAQNCSYDVQHTASLGTRRMTLLARTSMPFISDANPLFDGYRFHADVDPENANTNAHRRAGQNVLAFDGTVAWLESPILGPGGDNIWQAGNIRRYKGDEAPTSPNDVFLVP